LKELIKTLQAKAEANGDPSFLKCKINELLEEIKASKREEEKKGREISEMRHNKRTKEGK